MTGAHEHPSLVEQITRALAGLDQFTAYEATLAGLAARVAALEAAQQPLPPSYGVPTGTTLTALTAARPGDTLTAARLIIRTPGAVYEDTIFPRLVEVRAPGVIFRRSLFVGIPATIADQALVYVNPAAQTIGQPSATMEDCTLSPEAPNNSIDGVRGSNVTLRRCDISATVDGIVIHGVVSSRTDPNAGNVLVEDTHIHDLTFYPVAPYQTNGSHNDGVQVVGGKNITIRRTVIDSPRNACLMIQQNLQNVGGVLIENNTLIGGAASINVYDKKVATGIPGLVIRGNRFAKTWVPPIPGQETPTANYPILITPNTLATAVVEDNAWIDGSLPGPVVKVG